MNTHILGCVLSEVALEAEQDILKQSIALFYVMTT